MATEEWARSLNDATLRQAHEQALAREEVARRALLSATEERRVLEDEVARRERGPGQS